MKYNKYSWTALAQVVLDGKKYDFILSGLISDQAAGNGFQHETNPGLCSQTRPGHGLKQGGIMGHAVGSRE